MKHKNSQYSLNAKVITIGVVVIVLLLNAILVALDSKISLEIDFTKNQFFALTETSKNIISQINEDTEIMVLSDGTESEELSMIQNVLSKYAQENDNISVRTLNVDKNPAEIQPYLSELDVSYNSLLIEQADGDHRVVNAADFFNEYGYSYIERKVTANLKALAPDAQSFSVYFTKGHAEQVSQHATRALQSGGYSVSSLDTLTQDFPDTADSMVIISAPKNDFSPEEINRLDMYLDQGGNVQLYLDPLYGSGELPNLQSYLLTDWGIDWQTHLVLDSSTMIENSYMLGEISDHEIVASVAENQKRAGYSPAFSFREAAERPSSITLMPLLSSSGASYAKPSVKSLTEQGVIEKKEGDETGPFDLLLAATRDLVTVENEELTGKLIVGGSWLIFDELTADPRFANEDILLNSVSWMSGGDAALNIPAKLVPGGYMFLSDGEVWTWFTILVVLVPLAILITGIVIFVKRRYR